MATVVRQKGTQFWIARMSIGGKAVVRSTRLEATDANREAALLMARGWEDMARRAAAGEDIRQHFLETLRELVPAVEVPRPWVTWVQLADQAVEGRRRKGIRTAMPERHLKSFTEWLGDRALRDVKALDAHDVDAWYGALLRKVSPTTAKFYLAEVRRSFRLAVARGWMDRNPAEAVERRAPEPVERLPFTLDEVQALLGVTRGTEWETMILLGLCLGAREMDCARMRWEAVNWEARSITWLPAKKARFRKPVTLALVNPLAAHLEERRKATGFMCPEMAERTVSAVSASFVRRIMPAAGVDPCRTSREVGNAMARKSFHSLRHTLATLLQSAGVADLVARRITDHASAAVAEGYRHGDAEMTRDPLERVLVPFTKVS